MLYLLPCLLDQGAKKIFGTSISELGNDAIDYVAKTLGFGSGAVATGSLSDLGAAATTGGNGAAAITPTSTNGPNALGIGKDALGGYASGAVSLAEPAIGAVTGIGTYAGNGMYQTADGFLIDMGTGTSAATTGATTAGSGLEAATSFLSSAPGLALTAAGIKLLMGGDIKSAAITGGLTYAGAALGSLIPGVGTLIGGAVGGLISSFIGLGGQAKTDSAMMMSSDTGSFKDGIYAETPWGNVGFKGKATRHIDVSKEYQQAFNFIAGADQVVSSALTAEENAKVSKAMTNKSFRKESNEGTITSTKVIRDTLNYQRATLKSVLGDTRFNALGLNDYFSAIIANTYKKPEKHQDTITGSGYNLAKDTATINRPSLGFSTDSSQVNYNPYEPKSTSWV